MTNLLTDVGAEAADISSTYELSTGQGYTWVNFRCKYPGLVGHYWMQFNIPDLARYGSPIT